MAQEPLHTGQPVPEGYFENLENQILAKTIGIENWAIPGTKNLEACFPVPEGYWLQQEEQIRLRSRKPAAISWSGISKPILVPLLASLLLLLAAGIFLFKPQQETWEAKVENLEQEELIAYISNDETGLRLTEQEAAVVLKNEELPETELKINEKDLEKAIDQLNESELPNLTEISYED